MAPYVADEVFWSVLDVDQGRLTLASTVQDVVLSAALLTDLVLSGHLGIDANQVTVLTGSRPTERLAEVLFVRTAERVQQQPITVTEWLATFAPGIAEVVGDRLVRSGDLVRDAHRRLGRTTVRFRPTDPSQALLRSQRIWSYLRTGVPLSGQDLLVAALLLAADPDQSSSMSRELARALSAAPAMPLPFVTVLAATHRAVEVAVTRRV